MPAGEAPSETWWVADLGDPTLVAGKLDQIEALAKAADGGTDTHVFIRHESGAGLHCTVMAYLPPAAAALADLLGARPCLKPKSRGLDAVVGGTAAWMRYFGDDIDSA